MAEDHIRYDILAQEALRGVMRKVLAEVARTGLPGNHHFFITFLTGAPGVRISTRLRERYPEQMTIVIQFQYWDLKVTDTGFEVGLSFSDVPERLEIPFSAVRGFYDPSVNFELEFDVKTEKRRQLPTKARQAQGRDGQPAPAGEEGGARKKAAEAAKETPGRRAAGKERRSGFARRIPQEVARHAEVVNLRRSASARRARRRSRRPSENRALHGRTKAEKPRDRHPGGKICGLHRRP